MSISSLNNPLSGLTNILNGLVNGVGQGVQTFDSVKGGFEQQDAIHHGIGNPESLDAQRDVAKNSEEFNAGLIAQAQAAQQAIETQSLINGLGSAREQINNTKISSMIKNASGINY
jgi:hypothetical protein